MLKQNVAEAPILRHFDRTNEVHIMLFANEWGLSKTLLQLHEDKLYPVRFCGRVLKDAEMNYHPAEKEVLPLLLLLKTCYTQLAGRTLHVYTRFSTLEWITKLSHSSGERSNGQYWYRLDPPLLYAKLPLDYSGLVVSFDGSAKTEKDGGYGSCAWVV
ncbi:hypothetical protein PHMEG_00034290 [Phytophthora megakarya]|uniref:Reverse transcriptase/retrotransposon-derived protein RNase H-like domain-containing protein n=1 Tax=Phytophthora megakarya TaxID=4795 RepID=A0A225URR0_9STRA|nr:hypothetical protein PHMEG_00034290 [Phytophthora megakarya]